MKKIIFAFVALVSSAVFALDVQLISAQGLKQIKCDSISDLNQTSYVVSNYQVEANDLSDIKLTMKARFFTCSMDDGQLYLRNVRLNEMTEKAAINGIDANQNFITNTYFEKIKLAEFYVSKNFDTILTSAQMDDDSVTLSFPLTDVLSVDQIIDSINGVPQFFTVDVSARPLIELYDNNKNLLDRNFRMWKPVKLTFKMEMLAPGL